MFESSKAPLNKWMLETFLMSSSKKGISAHQIGRTLSVSAKTAWFICRHIRAAMMVEPTAPLGGPGKVIEAEETYIGRKEADKRNSREMFGREAPVLTLVELEGEARSFHVANVTAKPLRPIIVKLASPSHT